MDKAILDILQWVGSAVISIVSVVISLYIFTQKSKKERDLAAQLQTDKILASMKEQQAKELESVESRAKERERLDAINAEQDKRVLSLEYEIKETKHELGIINEQLHNVSLNLEAVQKDIHSLMLTMQSIVHQPRRRNARTN